MDELGRDVADESAEGRETDSREHDANEMSGPVASAAADLRKRRSTRIVQAVPLTVTGVDALGRPFTEKTSTLIINCHGCRYQSKHYVLKNMWVSLEVPHQETGQPPRTVRGRVAWIQRPRTVRQLFQVALELEIPGNVWGIAFPPQDWFPFPEPEQAKAAAAAAGAGGAHQVGRIELPADTSTQENEESASESEFNLPLAEEAPSATDVGNVRPFPVPASATDASLQLARQFARLLTDARAQIEAAARDAAEKAVEAERRISLEQWEQATAVSREQLSHDLAAAIQRIEEEAAAHGRVAQNTAAEALQRDLPRWVAPQLEELTRDLTAQLSQEAVELEKAQREQIAKDAGTLRTICSDAERLTTQLRETATQVESRIAARTEEGLRAVHETARREQDNLVARQNALCAETIETEKRLNAALHAAEARWQNYVTGEMDAVQTRGQIAIDNAIAEGQARAANSLSETANSLLSAFQQEAERAVSSFRESASTASGESERHLAELTESARVHAERLEVALARANEASTQLDNFAERIQGAQHQALHEFHAQIDDVLSLHRNELHRRSDSLFEEMNARIRATFEDSTQRALTEFRQQADAMIQPDLLRAHEAVQRIAGGRSLLEAATALQQERIRTAADEAFAEALGQFRANLGSVEQVLRDSADAVTAKSLADLENRAESAKHQALEDVLKSAEWYEKKAQTQIQHLAEKAGEQASARLHEKAGEISQMFANELNQASRSFMNQAQGQMEEVVRDSFERARALFSEAAETTTAAFIDEIQRQARQELGGFEAEVQRSAAQTRSQMEAARTDLAQKVTTEQENFLRRFQSTIHGEVEHGVVEMNQRVQSGFGPLLDAWKSMTEGHQAEMQGIYAQASAEAAERYKTQLENLSKQWMLATVATLDHQSRDVVAGISASAEEKLRDTCTKVFAEMGEALRERLRQIASNFVAATPRHSN